MQMDPPASSEQKRTPLLPALAHIGADFDRDGAPFDVSLVLTNSSLNWRGVCLNSVGCCVVVACWTCVAPSLAVAVMVRDSLPAFHD